MSLLEAARLRADDEKGWRATFYTTGMEHSPTSATGSAWERTPWRAVQGAVRDALRRLVKTLVARLRQVVLKALQRLGWHGYYYGTTTGRCPGGTFLTIPSPQGSPGQTVSTKLTGLKVGEVYDVAVTAVSKNGTESDCSTPASARARSPK